MENKRRKSLEIVGIFLVLLLACCIGVSFTQAWAFTGITTELTEEQLYNETNTYNVSHECFDGNGNFITTT